MNNKEEELFKQAFKARKKAYTPYSQFKVGAALLTTEGKIYTGSNVENISYSLTNCAERTAIFKAVSEGYHNFEKLLITADTDEPVIPCGACRQVIKEFGDDIEIIMTNLNGDICRKKINELLPLSFNFNKGD